VVPDWGHYPAFEYSPQRLEQSMEKLQVMLKQVPTSAESRLPLATPLSEYRGDLAFFANLFLQLAGSAIAFEELQHLADPAGLQPPVTLDEALCRLDRPPGFPQRPAMEKIVRSLRSCNVAELRAEYWQRVYGIYDQIAHPADPRAERATDVLFRRFHAPLTIESKPLPKRTPNTSTR